MVIGDPIYLLLFICLRLSIAGGLHPVAFRPVSEISCALPLAERTTAISSLLFLVCVVWERPRWLSFKKELTYHIRKVTQYLLLLPLSSWREICRSHIPWLPYMKHMLLVQVWKRLFFFALKEFEEVYLQVHYRYTSNLWAFPGQQGG